MQALRRSLCHPELLEPTGEDRPMVRGQVLMLVGVDQARRPDVTLHFLESFIRVGPSPKGSENDRVGADASRPVVGGRCLLARGDGFLRGRLVRFTTAADESESTGGAEEAETADHEQAAQCALQAAGAIDVFRRVPHGFDLNGPPTRLTLRRRRYTHKAEFVLRVEGDGGACSIVE